MPNWATTPLIPQSWTDAAAKWAQPGLNTSPAVAALKGFGAGALEGIRGLSTPVGVAGMVAPELGGAVMEALPAAEAAAPAMRGLMSAGEAMGTSAQGANDMMNPTTLATMQKMYQQANPVFQDMEKTGMFAGPRTTSNIGLARPAVRPLAETLGETDPSFTSVGGESLYNIGKASPTQAMDPAEAAYRALLQRGGR